MQLGEWLNTIGEVVASVRLMSGPSSVLSSYTAQSSPPLFRTYLSASLLCIPRKMQPTYIEVSQLAPSTSFYAAILQPLGLHYLTLESVASGPECAAFGSSHGPVLHLRQITSPAILRISSVRLSAPSSTAIQAFYRKAVEANPAPRFAEEDSLRRSTIFDLDGNKVQAICIDQISRPDIITGRFTLTLDPQPATDVCQVLGWDTYTPESLVSGIMDDSRNAKDTPKNSGLPEKADSVEAKTEQTNSFGMSAVFGAIIGVAAGAAAGAAITYSVMSSSTPEVAPREMDGRQRAFPTSTRAVSNTAMSTGLVDRGCRQSLPSRSQRIKFEEEQTSTLKKPSTRTSHAMANPQSYERSVDHISRVPSGNELVRIPRDVEMQKRESSSRISPSASSMMVPSTRRIAISSSTSSSPKPTQKLIEDRKPDRKEKEEHEMLVSNRSHVSSSSFKGDKASKRSNEFAAEKEHEMLVSNRSYVSSTSLKDDKASRRSNEFTAPAASSSTSKRHHRKRSSNERRSHDGNSKDELSSSKSSSGHRSSASQYLEKRSTAQGTEVSRRSSKSAQDQSGITDFFDTKSHVSLKEADVPSSQVNHTVEDRRSRVSARDVPLPASRVGTSEFFDTVSHVSTRKKLSSIGRRDTAGNEGSRSEVSARNVPLPASCVDGGTTARDRRSQVSARNIPLPASCVGTENHGGSRSQISARNVPLPGSHVGTSRANWDDDDVGSIAPSDSISCIGSK